MCQTGTSCEAFLKKQHRTVNSKNRRTDGSRPVFTSSFCMRNGKYAWELHYNHSAKQKEAEFNISVQGGGLSVILNKGFYKRGVATAGICRPWREDSCE